ncbi:MAG: leucyl aminopeptidase [Candidatus Andersenbacteria bacterium]
MLTITSTNKEINQIQADILVIPVHQGKKLPELFEKNIHAQITTLMQKTLFQGEWGRAEVFIAPEGLHAPLIAIIGMGSEAQEQSMIQEGLRRGIALVAMQARNHVVQTIAIIMPGLDAVEPIAEALYFTNYWFAEHSELLTLDEKARSLQRAILVMQDKKDVPSANEILKKSKTVMSSVTHTRNLVNQPASHMSPAVLVQEAKKIAKTSSAISLTILNRKQALAKKWHGFLAVARGSKEEPYVIHLTYTPKKKAVKKLVLIGKGITFDSGGLSLKPSVHMENMKIDMAGAATVLGLFSLLPTLNPDIEIHGIVAACENMPSGEAYRPGDVIKTMSGKTIEVLNTDAEGRVTLADALTYAQTLKPDAIIDLATLTGAVVVALGDTHAGLFGNSEELNKKIMQSAKKSGEGLVELPLPDEYRQTVQSMVGDVRNTATIKMGGAITAALFLREFIQTDKTGNAVAWAHLDIAGPVYAETPLIPYWQFGATGYGVRTLVNFVEGFGE